MESVLREGDRVRLFIEGASRVARIETLTSDRKLAQCSWTERGATHYVACAVHVLMKLPGPPGAAAGHL